MGAIGIDQNTDSWKKGIELLLTQRIDLGCKSKVPLLAESRPVAMLSLKIQRTGQTKLGARLPE